MIPSPRSYAGAAVKTRLVTEITDHAMSLTIESGNGWGSLGINGPFFIAVNRGTPNEEKILCDSITVNPEGSAIITVYQDADGTGRGADETTPLNHQRDSAVEHTWTAVDARQLLGKSGARTWAWLAEK